VILDILFLRCPSCRKPTLAKGLFRTEKDCRSCGRVFEKEPGYYAGAIYPLYGMAGLLGGLIGALAMAFTEWEPLGVMALASAGVALASPYLFWVSRCAFIHADERFFRRLGE
jgi:uncharacterized protein (DUF983 family)